MWTKGFIKSQGVTRLLQFGLKVCVFHFFYSISIVSLYPEMLYFKGNDPSTHSTREVIIKYRGGSLSRISELDSKYDPLHYVLLHPTGDLGWCPELKQRFPQATAMNYYAYRLAYRNPNHSLIHWAGRLFQQYCTDQYVKIESDRLLYILLNQPNFRVEQYYGVVDAYEHGVQFGNDTGT